MSWRCLNCGVDHKVGKFKCHCGHFIINKFTNLIKSQDFLCEIPWDELSCKRKTGRGKINYLHAGNLIKISFKKVAFYSKNNQCVHCGIKLSKWLVFDRPMSLRQEKTIFLVPCSEDYFIFTIDHVIPKSAGGANHHSNYQVMCYKCNSEKSNLSMSEFSNKII